jgi:hypothetical protein
MVTVDHMTDEQWKAEHDALAQQFRDALMEILGRTPEVDVSPAAARRKIAEAIVLVQEARAIFFETDHQVDHANAGDALEYLREIEET